MKVNKRKASSFLSSLRIPNLSFKKPACAGHQRQHTFMKAPAHLAATGLVWQGGENQSPAWNVQGSRACGIIHWHGSAMALEGGWSRTFKRLGQLWGQFGPLSPWRILRRSTANCNASISQLICLSARYLHSARFLDWPSLDSEIKISVMFWAMTSFPQEKKQIHLNWQS